LLHVECEDGKCDLWTMKADGTARERITDDQSQSDSPAMSPEGRYIVFSSDRSGNNQIWRIDSDGRNLKQLTSGVDQVYIPKITADGRSVIYSAWAFPVGSVARKISIDRRQSVLLAEGAEEIVLSPDGKMMAYKTFDKQKRHKVIIVKRLEGDGPVRVFDFPEFPIYRIEQWTKDGLLCLSANSNQIILVPTDG